MASHDILTRFDSTKIDRIFAPLDQCREPGAAVAIAIGGTPVYRRGFGLANMELPILIGPAMRMRIGSITKHVTCLAYMLLCEQGRAGIDDPIEKHVPEIHPIAHGVTMRQLMGHTSGLRDILSISMSVHGTSAVTTDRELAI
jgi:CubicO group peptidase (beta-lactamase class C family)